MGKNMKNALIAMDKSGSFRVYLAITNEMTKEAALIHQTSALATAALGRTLAGAGLMALMLKNSSDKLTIRFKGDGLAGEILATAAQTGKVKGYISNPDVDLPLRGNGKMDVGGAVGIGTLTVIKDLGLKEPTVGQIDLVSGEIAEDLTTYFFLSEQQSTLVALGVKVEKNLDVAAAGGIIIQMLPDADPEAAPAIEAQFDKIPALTEMIEEALAEVGSQDYEKACKILLEKIFSTMPEQFQVAALETRDLDWLCDCSTERLEKVILSLGKEELEQMAHEDQQAEIVCQFCTKVYHFDKEHLEMLLRVLNKSEEFFEKRQQMKEEESAKS
ncbi:MAG: Hsp33 family molecular chaperone HslO [Eubacteriales bacterium]|nr:Hsp33 family molecular chaperone HslO [Eubacteriales bacterium]